MPQRMGLDLMDGPPLRSYCIRVLPVPDSGPRIWGVAARGVSTQRKMRQHFTPPGDAASVSQSGRALASFTRHTAKANDIFLEVRESNIAAIQLYKRYHFEQVGVRKSYYQDGENAIVMKKSLV